MFIKANDEAIRYTGRWSRGEWWLPENSEIKMTTTNPGSMIEIAYSGKVAVLHFDVEMNMHPYPHLWIIVDDGAKMEVAVDHIIRIEDTPTDGDHLIKVIFKSAVEIQHRWNSPLIGKIRFKGAEVDNIAKLPEDDRKIIEFIGDSITEGVLIDDFYNFNQVSQFNRPYQDDSTATYAYLTATKLNLRPYIVAYGGVGATCGGAGSVPKASESYPYNFKDSLAEPSGASLIVINHGANDKRAESECFIKGYKELLDSVRKLNPDTKIVLLTPFNKSHTDDIKALADDYNKENNDDISVIDSTDWIPVDPLHPLRDGHIKVSEHLQEELKKFI